MRKLASLTVVLFCVCNIWAQTGTISGKVTDSSGKKPLSLGTITVFKAADTSIITYRLSTESGDFKVPGLPLNIPLRVMVTYAGYEVYRKEIKLVPEKSSINLETIKMVNTSKDLDEVIVVAERPPVIIKKDTIEFNASAFKTLPNALVEDLLKKMPGIQVDQNGDISFNGQKVNRILVDGKRFFGDDPKMATRNLPSNFIDKVQVTDDKDQIAQNNDGDMSSIGKVINLTLKKGVKKGWFGKLYGGGGTDERYEAGGIANVFRDTLQLSLVGFSNNVNRSAFNMRDVMQLGGFERSGINSMAIQSSGGRESFALNGVSFGGMGNGLTTSSGLGFNLNHAPNKNLSFYGQYFYGNSRNEVINDNNTQRFIADTIVSSRTLSNGFNSNHAHNLSAGTNWRIDSLTNMTFGVNYNYTGSQSDNLSSINTINNKLGVLNNGNGSLSARGHNDTYGYNFSLTHRFSGKRARTLSLYHNFNKEDKPVDNITESVNNYLYPFRNTILFGQLRRNNTPSTSFFNNVSYNDQLTKKLSLRLSTRFTYTKTNQDVFTFGKHVQSGAYDSLNQSLSNGLHREESRWTNGISLGYKINKVTVNLGTDWLLQWINNDFTGKNMAGSRQYYSDVLLTGTINWKRYNFRFSQDVSAPYINYLNPVPDSSNPFSIVDGNPDLLPSKRNTFSINGNIANIKKNLNIFTNAYVTFANNAVINAVGFETNGVQTTRYINADGQVNAYASITANRQYKHNQRFIVTVNTTLYGGLNKTPMYYNKVMSNVTRLNVGPSLGLSLNWHDVVEFNPRYTPSYAKNYYSNHLFNDNDVITHNLFGEVIVRTPKKLVWESNVSYRYNDQLAPGIPKTNIFWNAALSLLVFREDKGQFKLAVYDILNSNNNAYRNISANTIVDNRSNVLQRYVTLTFTYNVRAMGAAKQKVGGRQSLFMF